MVPFEVVRALEPLQVPKLPMVVEPVFETENSVEVEKTPAMFDEEAMAKSVWLGVLEAPAWMERVAKGEEVPSPTLPLCAKVVEPRTEVEEAKMPDSAHSAVVVAAVVVPKTEVVVKG